MRASPPELARRVLARSLEGDPAGPAILGDLHEDFIRVARERGPRAAGRWYTREALQLAAANFARKPFRARREGRGLGATPSVVYQDGVFALRALRRSPGFAVFTALVIGLGVGAATAVFSVLRPLVLAPLPFEDPSSLVWIFNDGNPEDSSLSATTSRAFNLRDFRERSRSFEGITGYNAFFDQAAYTLTGSGEPARLVGVNVANDFLDVLGVPLLHGRSFTGEEGRFGGPPAVILGHGFWRTRFGGDPGIVGRSIVLNGIPRDVVGVLPASFDFASVFAPGKRVDFLRPWPISEETNRQGNTMSLVGRLRPGVTAEAAEAELDAIVGELQREQPDRWGLAAGVTPLQAHLSGPFRPALLLLAGAAATLLLIVCVNVSNLLLARAPKRAREVAVRKAFGATRVRMARQLILESLAISLAGAVLGAVLAWAATEAVAGTAGIIQVPLLEEVRVDGVALLFAAAVAILTGLLIGAVPALHVAEGTEAGVLRGGGRGSTGHRRSRRVQEGLVVAEVTLACVLLVAGGLLVRSFRAVLDVELGFEPRSTVAWQLNPSRDFESRREEAAFYAVLTDRVAAIPGIEAAGLIDALPLGRNRSWGFRVVGRPEAEDTDDEFFPHMIDPGYLDAMSIPVLRGRNITAADDDDAPRALLLNEWGARRIFGDAPALGERLHMGFGPDWEVVGIVADVRHLSPEMGPGIQMYMPIAQLNDFMTVDLVVRSDLPTPQVASAVSAALAEVDPSMPTREFWTMESRLDRAVSARRFTLGILTTFGVVALLLAGLGIYGVLAHSVSERRAEIGIRMAMGATVPAVVRSVLGRTLLLALAGIAGGAVLSLGSARLVGSLLYGVSAADPMTFAAMALVLLLVAAAAGGIPAMRAARTRGVAVLTME